MTQPNAIAGTLRTDMVPQAAPIAAAPHTLDKELVHKAYDQNVLVSHIEAVPAPAEQGQIADGRSGRTDHFHGVVRVHQGHKFFFEHDRSHISGLYLIEASRQMSIAVAHLFYQVSLDVEFVMTECSAQFSNVANLEDPLLAKQMMSGHVYRKGRLSSMHSEIVIRQRNVQVARLAGTMILLSKVQLQYLEQRGRKP
jgi:hypothetical protein